MQVRFCLILLMYTAFAPINASAQELDIPVLKKARAWMTDRVEAFNGADTAASSMHALSGVPENGEITDISVSGYGGVIVGLNGPLASEGWRVRLSASQGQFAYGRFNQPLEQRNVANGDYDYFDIHYAVESMRADGMIGYNLNLEPMWLKLYAGIVYRSVSASRTGIFHQNGVPADMIDYKVPEVSASSIWLGDELGFGALAEIWRPLGSQAWASGHVSLSSAGTEFAASAKAGWKVPVLLEKLPALAIGPETAIFGDEYGSAYRAGAFASFTKANVELTISGGVSTALETGDDSSYYGALNLYRRF